MTEAPARIETIAEKLLNRPIEDIEHAAKRVVRGDHGNMTYELDDGSMIESRHMSGRSAYLRNGWRVKDS